MTILIRRAASLRSGEFKQLIRVASVAGRLPKRDVMLLWLTHSGGKGADCDRRRGKSYLTVDIEVIRRAFEFALA
ncbi:MULTISPECIES: hypothetical protein [unclassified Pseudomonas]|uniref:hypothetical protein n=1 Tax=unclassified Pseudomonas TaxID=196821 RepID=UPI001F58F0EA|nr:MULTISPECIES: hypothetical protein [unclassified Pseudomonas]